ncbi:Uma2 family endonuclease [Streptomyces varsoviensis]|uniref:Uma2 family endonuclease n=1 Tax=Streptomyces varsoviensis TaxID=67373 RepID=UPI0034072783
MTAPAHPPTTSDPTLLDYFLALEIAEGFRAQFIGGEIVVSPVPDGDHEDCLSTLVRQALLHSATGMAVSGHKGLTAPSTGSYPDDHLIPDAAFAPRARRPFRGAPSWMPSDGMAIAAEVTYCQPDRDRVAKRLSYARAGIPLYLLVDREKSTTVLFSEPKDGDYTETHLVPFGKPLPLPAPFSFDLDTSEFL